MKTIILPAVAALAIALSTGAALANSSSNDNGFAIYMQDQGKGAPAHREFLSGEATYPIGTDNGWAAYQQDQSVTAHRSFLSGSDAIDPLQGVSENGRDSLEFRRVQGQ